MNNNGSGIEIRPEVSFGFNEDDDILDGYEEHLAQHPDNGFVYFIENSDGCIKIGQSRDPRARLQECQTHNSYGVTLLGVIPSRDPVTLERCLHSIFLEHRMRDGQGEWFFMTYKQIEERIQGMNEWVVRLSQDLRTILLNEA